MDSCLKLDSLSQKAANVKTMKKIAKRQAETPLVAAAEDLPAPIFNLSNTLVATAPEEAEREPVAESFPALSWDFLMVSAMHPNCLFKSLFSSRRALLCFLTSSVSARATSSCFSSSSTNCFLRERD